MEPRWIESGERRDAANHPSGYPDVANRANMDLYADWSEEHADDGTHKTSAEIIHSEIIEVTGNGTDDRDIYTTQSHPRLLFLFREDTNAPVFRTASMTGDDTKELGVSAFQADMIQSIDPTSDTIEVGADVAVNANLIDYFYLVFGPYYGFS